MIRHSDNTSESWKNLNWKKFRRNLFRLQCRVFKAIRAGDKRKAMSLQKLILKSFAARFLAIRQVSQLNAGKKTAGIDGKKSLKFEERFELSELLKASGNDWYHQGLRSVPIPKKDGSTRMLKIPTIADRAWQCLAKFALEPAHEATFHSRSYGFRPGRSAHDAQKILFLNLRSSSNGINKRVIELDIEKCFDRISHTTIMDNLIAPKGIKSGIFRCLKAGINPEFPEQGTPQGGVVSPLLANIALNGIESIHRYHKSGFKITGNTPKVKIIEPSIRYADDMVIILRPEDDAIKILDKINEFLADRGMKVSEKKTKVTAATDGFDFLGWHFKMQSNGKFRCTPSVDNYKKFRHQVKAIVNCSNIGSTVKAQKLAPVVKGWRNYHKFCKMDGSRFSLYHTQYRAYKVFNMEAKKDRYTSKKLLDIAFPAVSYSENKHVNVKGEKSPYDGDMTYWSERNSKLYDGETSKALKRQNQTCGHCGLKCISEERIHLHHIDGNHNNWKFKNLVAIHESCHDYQHMGTHGYPLRISGAGCRESGTSGSNREVRGIIAPIDSTKDPNQVRFEIPVDGYDAAPSKGITDYCLYQPNGEVIAVVEAKRQSRDSRIAQTQVEHYVTEIAKHQSFPPFAFLTNNIETYFWDTSDAAKRQVAGFFSPADLANLLYIRQNKISLSQVPINPQIAVRVYQQEAIRRVCETFDQGKRRALLVMATGTGKTRTTMTIIDLFLRANQTRKVLFVADRDNLVEQALTDGFKPHIQNEPCDKRSLSLRLSHSQLQY